MVYDDDDVDEVSIVSYNVHSCIGCDGEYSVERISRLLSKERPDIVCLQEIEQVTSKTKKQKTRIWSVEHSDDQPKQIAKSLGLDHVVFAPAISSKVVSKNENDKEGPKNNNNNGIIRQYLFGSTKEIHGDPDDNNFEENKDGDSEKFIGEGGKFGICILSRYPVIEKRMLKYSPYGTKTKRNALACLVRIPNKSNKKSSNSNNDNFRTIWIVNTHLGCHTGGEQFEQSLELSQFLQHLIVENVQKVIKIKEEEEAVEKEDKKKDSDLNHINCEDCAGIILCGDFNSLPFFQSIRTLEYIGMIDAWKEMEGNDFNFRGGIIGLGSTFPVPTGILPSPLTDVCCIIPPFMRLDYMFTNSFDHNNKRIRTSSIRVVNRGTTIFAIKRSNSNSNDDNDEDEDDDDDDKVDIKASDHLALSATFCIEEISESDDMK